MAEPKKLGYWDDYFRPVGYTEEHVRRLARVLDNQPTLQNAVELDPFRALLDGGKDNG